MLIIFLSFDLSDLPARFFFCSGREIVWYSVVLITQTTDVRRRPNITQTATVSHEI